ncbi:Glutamate-rich protein 2 [Oryzias melastigma]|uniref:Glutamate-rich protein 2 n=1 Tax=Oryzias melastigma TaxID=30732 RepID=A0A834F3T0_ORYME|nr:Glutamate-rich protein 2 [Oryzias melastigma]
MDGDGQTSASVDEDLVKQPLMEPRSADSAASANGKNEQPDEEDEDKAPLGLLMGFIRALKNKDFQLAFRLCQMTLIYEPTNPEASEILPLLQQKLLEEQGTEESSEEEDDSERDERSSCTPTSSCSSSSSDTDEERRDPDDDEQEKHA